MEIRTLIREALSRSNVVPRKQPAPGDLMESGLKLLKGIVSNFNNDNYLAFTQQGLTLPARQVIHIYDKEDTMVGDYNKVFPTLGILMAYTITEEDFENGLEAIAKDTPGKKFRVIMVGTELQWFEENADEFDPRYQQMRRYADAYHVKVPGVAKLNTLNIDRNQPYGMLKLNFIPRGDFYSQPNGDLVWTFRELAQGEWEIEVKPYIVSNAIKLKLDYNRAIEFDFDTDLRIPDAYIELLTVALTHSLAVKYPRMDDAHVARLADDVKVMLENVRTPKADQREVRRESTDAERSSYWGVVSGRMWGF